VRTYRVAVRDLEYLRADGAPLLARLYEPQGDGPFPAIVDVHGGAWIEHDRTHNATIDAFLAATGIVVFALDFHAAPAAAYPASVAEINAGIRFLKTHAAAFGSAARLVGGFGTSSGGHQLVLNALRPDDPYYRALPPADGESARLAYVVLGWPVVDPQARYRLALERGDERLLRAHRGFFGPGGALAEGNPQLLVERGAAQELPPLLVVQGTDDDRLTPDMAERFAAAYRTAGGAVELATFPGQPHAFMTRFPDDAATVRARDLVAAFIHERATACERTIHETAH
jgi:acetyl esterase